jgi:hypothetical protein
MIEEQSVHQHLGKRINIYNFVLLGIRRPRYATRNMTKAQRPCKFAQYTLTTMKGTFK